AAVARALELVLRREPPRRAAEMRALREQRVETFLGADDPHALVLLVLLAHLADREVGREAGLERRRRLEEDAWERGADGGEQRDARERREDAPGEAAENIPSRPEAPELRALAGALVALALLLGLPARGERGRIFLLRFGLGHRCLRSSPR